MEEHKNICLIGPIIGKQILAEPKESEHQNHPILAKVPLGVGSFPSQEVCKPIGKSVGLGEF